MKLEALQKSARVRGLAVDGVATVKAVEFHGQNAVEVTFTDSRGAPHIRIVSRDDEPSLGLVEPTRAWSFDADGDLFRLVSEARRIELAWLFDPYVAITSSTIQPLPHQISAVYEEMLPRQPMRFLLADDPGAGKTIMAGLLIKELMIRGDLEPGRAGREVRARVRAADARHDRRRADVEPLRDQEPAHRAPRPAQPERGRPRAAQDRTRVGPRGLRRGAPDERPRLRRRDQVHEALPHGRGPGPAHAQPVADDRDAAQRQRGGLPHLPSAARRRPLRGALPRGRAQGRPVRPHAAPRQGGPAPVRRLEALPRAQVVHGAVRPVVSRSPPLLRGHRLRSRRDEPSRAVCRQGGGSQGQRRFRPHDPPAAPRVVARGHLPFDPAPPRAARGARARREAGPARSRRGRPAHRRRRTSDRRGRHRRAVRRGAPRRARGGRAEGRRPRDRRAHRRGAPGRDHVSVGQLAEWFARYLYLPRLATRSALETTVQDGASVLTPDDTFALAAGYDEARKRYTALKVGEVPAVVDRTTLVVKTAIARAQRDAQRGDSSPPVSQRPGGESGDGGIGGGGTSKKPEVKKPPNLFVASVKLDSTRLVKDVGKVAIEVLEHLSTLPDADVEVTLEMRVRVPDGVAEDVVRTVSENAKALKFGSFGFERE